MKYLDDSEAFVDALSLWRSKGQALSGFEVHSFPDGTFEPVVYDYAEPDISYTSGSGPYKTWRGAFGAIGAAFDRIDRRVREREVGV